MKVIYTLSGLKKIRPTLTGVVLAGGAFDVLHSGHIEHIQRAQRHGETLIVHVVGNDRVREKKGPSKPIMDEKERASIIASLKGVSYVFIDNCRHYDKRVLDALCPDVLYFNAEGYTPVVSEYLSENHTSARVVVDRRKKINSSSKIVQQIREAKRELPK